MNRLTITTGSIIVTFSLNVKSQEERGNTSDQRMVNKVVKQLQPAQTIAVCDFKHPGGFVVTRIIRGDTIKVGQFWNSGSLVFWEPDGISESSVLMLQYSSDEIGNGAGVFQRTTFFFLDQSKQFLIFDSVSLDSPDKERNLISLNKIEGILKQK